MDTQMEGEITLHGLATLVQQLREQNALQATENLELHNRLAHLQTRIENQPANQVQFPPAAPLEPKLGLPEKFNGTRTYFRDFVNAVRLTILLQPKRYPDGRSQVGFLGSLLIGPALSWFAPLIEQSSPLLGNFDAFLKVFEETFGDADKAKTASYKLRKLQQGTRSAAEYAAEFQRTAVDLPWDEYAKIDQFRYGLRGDVKDLLLTFPEPTSLTEAVSQATRCDNRLYERRQERRLESARTVQQQRPAAYSQFAKIPPPGRDRSTATGTAQIPQPQPFRPTAPVIQNDPMQVDATPRYRQLTEEEKKLRRANNLCLYCGQPGHIIRTCPNRHPRTGQNHISSAAAFEFVEGLSEDRSSDDSNMVKVQQPSGNEHVQLQ